MRAVCLMRGVHPLPRRHVQSQWDMMIGTAVKLVSRLEGLCTPLARSVLTSCAGGKDKGVGTFG